MNILTLNCGSSSIKADLINTQNGNRLLTMRVERITDANPILSFNDEADISCPASGHAAVFEFALPMLIEKAGSNPIQGVGHRVVHGGNTFSHPTLIDETVKQTINDLSVLAPLHNPVNLVGIEAAEQFWPDVPHVAIFDTAFHQTLPKRAQAYALPKALTEKYGIRRYGFHGTSHRYVALKAAAFLKTDIRELRLITCHLGSGCSIAAVEYGRSVETSMGMTPLEGLVMGTRAGDVDAGVLISIMQQENLKAAELDKLLNKESGLKGLAGKNDMRDIIERATKGDEDARLAIQVFTHRLRKYIGAYATAMGGVDAIIFTGGIGENSAVIRHRVSQRLDFMGALINEDKNRDIQLNDETPVMDFSMNHSRVKLLAVATDEQLAIARQTTKLVLDQTKVNEVPAIPIAISARHVHLTQETVEQLFGKGYQLTEYKPLSQPGQFAANERVTLVGPKNSIEKVRILGPTRSKNQVEISRTDEFLLGIDAPVRESGKTENTPGVTLIGPEGKVDLTDGLICAWRHIHMTPDDAATFGVKDRDVVDVDVSSQERSLTFGNVLIRVSPKYKLEMHIDTDEGNAAEIRSGDTGTLMTTGSSGHLKKRHAELEAIAE